MAEEHSSLNRKLVLWYAHYDSAAYTDQMGVPRQGYVVTHEAPVTIVEVRQVPGMWGSKEKYEGWRAQDAEGKNYYCNWHSFPDDSMTPAYYWDTPDWGDDMMRWIDAEQAYSMHVAPHVRPNHTKAVPVGAVVCEKHDTARLPPLKCWRCEIEDLREARRKEAFK
jgi:hypothetical protein